MNVLAVLLVLIFDRCVWKEMEAEGGGELLDEYIKLDRLFMPFD